MDKVLLEIMKDNDWHVLREGLVLVTFETLDQTDDFQKSLAESKSKNRRALGDSSYTAIGDEVFMIDLVKEGISVDQLSERICYELSGEDACWIWMSNPGGMAVRRVR